MTVTLFVFIDAMAMARVALFICHVIVYLSVGFRPRVFNMGGHIGLHG